MKKVLTILFLFIISYTTLIHGQWQKTIIDDTLKSPIDIKFHDLNGDLKKDILVTDERGDELLWYENNYPIWSKRFIDKSYPGAVFCEIGDINGDSIPDVAATAHRAKHLALYIQNGMEWTKSVIDSNTDNAEYMALDDLNLDGKLDIIIGSFLGRGDVVWYENNYPDWHEHIVRSGGGDVPTLFVNDINGDNLSDIIVANSIPDKILVYINENKAESWREFVIDDSPEWAWCLNICDINNDNKIDLIATNESYGPVVWYENNHPNWTKQIIDPNLEKAWWPCGADVDKDDDIDIFVGTKNGYIFWYENDYPKWNKHLVAENLGPTRILNVTDLNGDNLPDAVVASDRGTVIGFINPINTAYSKSLKVSDLYLRPILDTLSIKTQIYNPHNNLLNVFAMIEGVYHAFQDSIQLFDDGLHNDGDADDNLWGEITSLSLSEDMYMASLSIKDETIGKKYIPPLQHFFTTKGPIKLDHYQITSIDSIINPGNRIKLSFTLRNVGLTDTVHDVDVKIIINDSTITHTTTGKPLFGDIPPGKDLTNSSRDFALSFKNGDDTCSVGSYEFGIEISSKGIVYWYDTFNMDVVTDVENYSYKVPTKFVLEQSYPNPFNPSTAIKYSIPNQSKVVLKVYDVLGSEVTILVTKEQPQGNYDVEFDGSELTSGIYFYRLQAGDFVETKKMILLK